MLRIAIIALSNLKNNFKMLFLMIMGKFYGPIISCNKGIQLLSNMVCYNDD